MLTTSTLTALTAALALGLSASGQSAAAQNTETVSVKVSYADLNLSTEAGAKVMLQRIRSAAKKICGDGSDDPVAFIYQTLPCAKATTDRAVAKFGNPIVTALNSGKSTAPAIALASNR
jgi:UrcA family protein